MRARFAVFVAEAKRLGLRARHLGVVDLTVSRGAVLFLGFLQNVALARLLLPEGLGHVSVANSTMGLAMILATAGLTTAIMRYSAVEEQDPAAWAVFRQSTRLCSVASVFVALGVWLLARTSAWVFDPVAGTWLPLLALSLPISSVGSCCVYYLQARNLMREKALLESVSRLVLLVGAVAGAWMGGFPGFAVGYVVGTVAGSLLTVQRTLAVRPALSMPSPVPQREILRFGTWSLFSQVLYSLLVTASVFCLSALTSDAASVGFYGLAAVIQQLTSAPMLAYLDATFPNMARESYDVALLRASRIRMRRNLLWISLAAGGAVAAAAPIGIPLVFGKAYVGSIPPLWILLLGQVVWSFGASAGRALLAAGWVEGSFAVSALAAVVNVGANLLLISHFGVLGAAFATAGTNVVWVVAVTGLARRLERSMGSDMRSSGPSLDLGPK